MDQYPFAFPNPSGYGQINDGNEFPSYQYPEIKMESNQFNDQFPCVQTESLFNSSGFYKENDTLMTESNVFDDLLKQEYTHVKKEVDSSHPVGKITVKDWCEHVDEENKRGKLTDYDICKTISGPFMGVRPKPLGGTYLPVSPISSGSSSVTIQSPDADYCNDVVTFRNFKFNLSSPSESVYRALNLWQSIISRHSEREAVDAVIGCIDNEQVRRHVLARKCSTISELISVLTSISGIDRNVYSPPNKRGRYEAEMSWHSPDVGGQHETRLSLDKVCQDEEFLKLTPQELICLIRKDELNVREEREVYNAVLSWVKFDEDRRYPRMEHILQAVRCQYLTPSFLKEQMTTCSVLQKVPACREYLAKIFQDLTLHKKPIVKERRPNTPRIIYVAGGYLRHSIDVFEAFNLDDNCWTTLPRLTVPRSGLGAAFLKGLFYAVGGRNTSPGSSYDSDWVDVYSPAAEQWRPCSPMATPRHRVGVAVMDGLLYAVGGSASSEYHKTVECYDPEKDTWSYIASMGRARLGVGVAVVNRLLYAVGGFDGARRSASVESYHPENNRWTEVAPMKYARSGAGVAAWNQYIYVVGGYDGASQLASVERYDTERDTWEEVTPMRAARSALSLAVLDNKLYAMGGYDGTAFLDVVEIYDPCSDTWSACAPLPSARSGHASAVCYQHLAHDLEPARRHDDVTMPGVVDLHAPGRL